MNTINDIWHGKSLLRSLMNQEIGNYRLEGTVVDVGAGKHPEYHAYFTQGESVVVQSYDQKRKDEPPIDLEVDAIPVADSSVDTVLAFNVLEHIYNHARLVKEMHRIARPGGQLIGFVPFFMWYHPDPKDYFRYTGEALRRIFTEAGFTNVAIREIGGGPFLVNYNNIVLSVPRIVRVALLPLYLVLDALFLAFRPNARKRFPLGYFFSATASKS